MNDESVILYIQYNGFLILLSDFSYYQTDLIFQNADNPISQKDAYDQLCQGKFHYPGNDEKTMDIVVKSVDISYEADSKGYYRPFYEFNVQIDGDNDDSILIDAMRYTRS